MEIIWDKLIQINFSDTWELSANMIYHFWTSYKNIYLHNTKFGY